MFVDADILRNGNDKLLDDLEEGLIILEERDEGDLQEVYHNKRANKLKFAMG